jgi:hypothetical protein
VIDKNTCVEGMGFEPMMLAHTSLANLRNRPLYHPSNTLHFLHIVDVGDSRVIFYAKQLGYNCNPAVYANYEVRNVFRTIRIPIQMCPLRDSNPCHRHEKAMS